MIAVLKAGTTVEQRDSLCQWFKSMDLDVNVSEGKYQTVIGLIGDTSQVDIAMLESLSIIEHVTRISDPFKKANKKFHPTPTAIEVTDDLKIGAGHFHVIAGPCSVESEEQILSIAEDVQASGATFLRGGAYKPRTSPYDFQGMHEAGLDLLSKAKKKYGLPIVTEIMNINDIPLFDDVDIMQVGARNMQNFDLLKELGKTDKVILIKRGLANTFKELLMSAEYVMANGNEKVILCERGIRTYETYTRNTLDLSAVPSLKEMTHLPIVVDPSHGVGKASLVPSMALAATAAGADGLIIEVHNDPEHALSDGPQSLRPEAFNDLMKKIKTLRGVMQTW